MQFRDLKTQYNVLKAEIDQQIGEVISQANFISGEKVEELEQKLANYVGAKHCISCANGTDALQLALMTWGIGTDDAVFVPDFTFFSTAEVVAQIGATPILVDVDRRTFNMSISSLQKAIEWVKANTKLKLAAVIPVDLFGQPADFPEILQIASNESMMVLEDGAQGFGGSIIDNGQKKRACSFGDISTTSFFPAKPLGCYGDGGAVFTDNDEWADQIRSLRVHGKGSNKYDNVRLGLNSRLDTMQAGILLIKLKAFCEYELDAVNNVARWYDEAFKSFASEDVMTPLIKRNYTSSWAQYTILLKNFQMRNKVQEHLKSVDIPSMIYYPKGLHEQIALSQYACSDLLLNNTEYIAKRCLSLPMHPYLDHEQVNEIVNEVAAALI